MSTNQTVDERIVEMQFNNADFESKIAKTLEHLQKLREATKMEDAGDGLKNLAKNVKDVNIDALTKSVDTLSSRFSAFGIVGMTVIQDLTHAAERLGAKLVDAITTAPKDGWHEYELYTDSVKTILNSAKDANGLPVTLDLVNKKLAELNEYSDKTIYSFSDMTQNIGKFTNAGVDLESAVKAIQGVANVAALSGANANEAARAMYNFGQALGTGTVKLVDWKSIVNANMATVDFKNELIKTAAELGTIKKYGDRWIATTYKGKKASEEAFTATAKFDDSLQQQWMTAEVLTKTLEKYTDEESELGKKAMAAAQEVTTFSKMVDTVKESMGSGWMNTWQLIFGDFDEQKQLWTGIYKALDNIIQKVSDFRNGILETWKKLGGRDDLIKAFSNIWDIVKAFVKPIQDAFASIFPNVSGENLADMSKKFREATDNLKEMFGIVDEKAEKAGETIEKVKQTVEDLTELAQAVIRGDYGNGDERRKKLEEEGKSYERVQNKVNELLGCSFRYEEAEEDLTEAMDENTEAGKRSETQMNRLMDAEGDMNRKQTPLEKLMMTISQSPWMHHNALENATLFFAGVAAGINTLKQAVTDLKIVDKIAWGLGKAFGFVSDIFGNIGRYLLLISGYLLETKPWLKVSEAIKNSVGGIGKKLAKFKAYLGTFKNISRITKAISSGIKSIRDRVTELFKKAAAGEDTGISFKGLSKILDVLTKIGKFLGGGLIKAVDAVLGVVFNIIDGTKGLKDSLGEFDILKAIKDWFDKAKDSALELVQNTKIGAFFESISKTIEPLITLVTDFFGKTKEEGTEAFEGMSGPLGEFGNEVEDAFSGFKPGGLIDRAVEMFEKVKGVLEDLPGLVNSAVDAILERGSLEFIKIPTSIEEFTTRVSEFIGMIKGNAVSTVSGFFGKLAEGIRSLKDNSFLKPFSSVLEEFAKRMDMLSESVTPWTKKIGKFISGVIEKLDGVSFKGVGLFMFLTAISYFAVKWASVGRTVANAFNNLSEFVLHGAKPFNKFKDKMKGFVLFAVAIELLAGAVWIMAKVPEDRFVASCIAVAAGLGLMVGAIILVEKMVTQPKDLYAAGVAFLALSASLVILAKAVEMWSKIKWGEFFDAGGKIILMLGALVTAVVAAGASGLGAGMAFLGIAIALMILPPVIDTYANLPVAKAFKAAVKIGAFMVVMGLAVRAAGETAKGAGFAFLGLAVALRLIVPVIDKFSSMSTGQLIGNAFAIATFLGMMSIAVRAAGQAQGVGSAFIGLAAGLLVMAVAIKLYAGMKLYTLIKGGTAVFIFLTMMTAAAKLSGSGTSKNIIALSVALIIIAGSLKVLSSIPWPNLIAGAVAMAIVLLAVTKALRTLDKADFSLKEVGKNALLVGLILTEVVAALAILNHFVAADHLLSLAESMSLVLLAVCAPIKLLKDTDWDGGLRAAVACGEFLGGLVTAFLAIGGIVEGIEWVTNQVRGAFAKDEVDMWQFLKDTAKNIGEVLNAFGSGLFEGITPPEVEENTSSLGTIAENLAAFAETMQGFFTATEGITDETAKRADILAGAVLKLCTAELIDAISQFIGGKLDAAKFGESLASLAEAFVIMNRTLAEDELEIDGEKFDQMIDIVGKFADLANAIPKIDGLEQKLEGTADLGKFAASLYEFMVGAPGSGVQGFRGFLAQARLVEISDDDLESIDNIKRVALKLNQVATAIPPSGGLLQKLGGAQDLGAFANNMKDFINGQNGKGGFKGFLSAVRLISITDADVAAINDQVVPATTAMVGLAKTIKENTSFIEWFAGSGDNLKDFGTNMGKFAEGLADFAGKIRGIAIPRIESVIAAVTKMAELNGSDNVKYNNLDTFSWAIESLGNALANFNTDTSAIDLNNLAEVMNQLSRLRALLQTISDGDYSNVNGFKEAMELLATDSISGFTGGLEAEMPTAVQAVSDLLAACQIEVTMWYGSFETIGQIVMSNIYSQATTPQTEAATKEAFKQFISTAIRHLGTFVKDKNNFEGQGKTAFAKFNAGLEDSTERSSMLQIIKFEWVNDCCEILRTYGVSEFFKKGQDCADGFARGLKDKASQAVTEAENMAERAQKALAKANDSNSPSKVYMRLGTYAVDGYVLGFKNNVGQVIKSVTDTGNAGILAMRDTVRKMSDMIDDEVDYRPTITPVLDLTQLANGMQTTRGLLSELTGTSTDVRAAMDIANAHNAALVAKHNRANKDYSSELGKLVENTRNIIDAAKRNRVAVIDGDYLYGYLDRRMGMA